MLTTGVGTKAQPLKRRVTETMKGHRNMGVTWKTSHGKSAPKIESLYIGEVYIKRKKKSNVKRVTKTLTSVAFGYWNYA